MSTLVFLTHTQPLASSLSAYYAHQGLKICSMPALSAQLNPSLILVPVDQLIVSSFMVIEWIKKFNIHAQHYYCIGPQTAQSLAEVRSPAIIKIPHRPPYSLKALLNHFEADLKLGSTWWAGSSQGLRRYYKLFEEHYPWINSHVTHWNWPLFFQEKKASTYFPGDCYVICSSINAALALSLLEWDTEARLLVSSPRLLKFFRNWSPLPQVSNEHWIKEIGYN